MNIELKYKFKYPLVAAMLTAMTLLFGAFGILSGVGGMITVPLTAGFLATLICVEKKRILSSVTAALLIIAELFVSFLGYFTLTSVASIAVATIMAIYYLKKKEKCDSALFGTLAVALLLIVSVALYISATIDSTSLSDIYEYFLAGYANLKESTISYVLETYPTEENANAVITPEYISEVFDAYLNRMVAIAAIVAFALVGLAHKVFCGLLGRYEKESDESNTWRFMPDKVFAYFYFALAFFSLFTMDTASVMDISIVNLDLILMPVFAYIGFRFASAALNKTGKSTFMSSLTVIVLILIFRSFAIQVLAAIGAFISIYRTKFTQDLTTSNK